MTQTSTDQQLETLKAEIEALKTEIRESRDYHEICNLQAKYGYYVDKGLWDAAADLFAPECTLEIAGRGVYVGQDRVRAYLHQLPPYQSGQLYNHMQLQPVVHIDSKSGKANGRWRSWMQVGRMGGHARWGEATYENAYVRTPEGWRIVKLHAFINFYVDYYRGWDKGAEELLRSTDGIEPDLPPSYIYNAFPDTVIAPFHYPTLRGDYPGMPSSNGG